MRLAPVGRIATCALLGACVLLGVPGRIALADDRAACFDAASQGQTLRDEHKLVEARATFKTCAQVSCPTSMQSDCAGWLDTVERLLPTVVLSAKNASGLDVVDVDVTLDGVAVMRRLNGEAFPVDPGPHEFRFAAAGGAKATERLLIAEGEKARAVAVVLSNVAQVPEARRPDVSKPPPSSSPLRAAGWIVGGAGVVSLATGVALLAAGSGDRSDCASGGGCPNQPALDKYNGGTGLLNASYGLIIGGAIATAAGVVLWVVSPSHPKSEAPPAAAVGVRFAPTRVSLEGAF